MVRPIFTYKKAKEIRFSKKSYRKLAIENHCSFSTIYRIKHYETYREPFNKYRPRRGEL